MPKPKKLAPKKVGEKVEKKPVHVPPVLDENGKEIEPARTEYVEETVDIIEMVYQEMTEDEIAELEEQEQMEHVPTLEERVAELERQVAELMAKPKPK